MGSNPTLSLNYYLKARDGFEPSLKDLQSFTLPLCYLANLLFIKIMFKKKENFFNYQNKIILKNWAVLRISSVKYIKNMELNKSFLKDFNKIENKIIVKENNFLKKLKK